MPRQVVTTALLITIAISALLSGCVTVSPERKNEVAEKLGWVTGSCLAIHNENLKNSAGSLAAVWRYTMKT